MSVEGSDGADFPQGRLFDWTIEELEEAILSTPKVSRSLLVELIDAVAALTHEERIIRVKRLIASAHALLDQALELHVQSPGFKLAGIVTMFSGGNDSTVLAHLFRDRATHVGMANTGIGIEKTRQYVRDVAASWDLPVIEKMPEPGYGYRDLILGRCRAKTGPNAGTVLYPGGFPGPGAHYMMYQRLKERAFEQIRNELVDNPRRSRVVFLGGRRASESNRRNALAVKGPIERKGSTVWVAPLINWTPSDMNTYRVLMGDVPRNEVSDLLHMSGECLCGAFAKEGELDEIGLWFPEIREEIELLQDEVRASGVVSDERRCTWGWGYDKDGTTAACDCRTA